MISLVVTAAIAAAPLQNQTCNYMLAAVQALKDSSAAQARAAAAIFTGAGVAFATAVQADLANKGPSLNGQIFGRMSKDLDAATADAKAAAAKAAMAAGRLDFERQRVCDAHL